MATKPPPTALANGAKTLTIPTASTLEEFKALSHLPYVRLSPSLKQAADDLGPLADLVGTWVGSKGWNMIAVPFPKHNGLPFTLLIAPYLETISFTPIGAKVPNRFGGGIDFVVGLLYELRIARLDTNEPMHIENGMFLYLGPKNPQQSVARHAAIPHGDSVLALGASGHVNGPPVIADVWSLPSDQNPIYIKQYVDDKTVQFDPERPEQVLRNAIAGQSISETTFISLSTANGGGILNIPFIGKNANTTRFDCVLWIEKVQSAGQTIEQLQYTQTSIIEFVQEPGKPPGDLIKWPHINVNTLVKQ